MHSLWLLSLRLTKTSINGLLGRGSMFIFSRDQLAEFLQLPTDWDPSTKTVLDLGAGDGAVTAVLQQFYNKVLATEASQPMLWRLEARGFELLSLDNWHNHTQPVNLISALNLLDRHPEPFTFLNQLRNLSRANENAPILLAIVFPWSQYSEFSASRRPRDRIKLRAKEFHLQVEEFLREHLLPAGFRLLRWARLPYLCEGDAYQSYYLLYDALILIQPSF